jgi:hypothetical protein
LVTYSARYTAGDRDWLIAFSELIAPVVFDLDRPMHADRERGLHHLPFIVIGDDTHARYIRLHIVGDLIEHNDLCALANTVFSRGLVGIKFMNKALNGLHPVNLTKLIFKTSRSDACHSDLEAIRDTWCHSNRWRATVGIEWLKALDDDRWVNL